MRTKICMICNKLINLSKDDFIHMIDYKSGKFEMEGYYHNRCWHDKLRNVITDNKEMLKEKMQDYIQKVKSAPQVSYT